MCNAMINLILFVLFIILQFLDFWTTYNVIKSGKGHEGNPIVAFGISKIGLIPALVIYKLFAIAIGWIIKDVWFVMLALDIAYGYVVYQNYKILKA